MYNALSPDGSYSAALAVGRSKRAVCGGPQRQRVCLMCTYVPKVVEVATEGGAQGGGRALQLAVRKRPRSPAERDRPRHFRRWRIHAGRRVRQRLETRGGPVSWAAANVYVGSSDRPCPSPALAAHQRASARFLFVARLPFVNLLRLPA